MDEIVGSDFGLWFYVPLSLFPIYWVKERLVEEAFDSMGSVLGDSITVCFLVHELANCGEEEGNAC